MNTDRELNTPESDEIYGDFSGRPHDSWTEGNMAQHEHESSEELDGCSRFKSQTSGETDTDNQNEVGETHKVTQTSIMTFQVQESQQGLPPQLHIYVMDTAFPSAQPQSLGNKIREEPSCVADNTKYDKIQEENCELDDILDDLLKEGNLQPTAYKESEQVSEPLPGSLECQDSAPIKPEIPMTNTCNPESALRSLEFNGRAFIRSDTSVPSVHTHQSGYKGSSLIQPGISAPIISTPTSCGKTVNNLLSDEQHEMIDGLNRYGGDLGQESEVGTKRKNGEKDTQNKKCKGTKNMQSEEEKKKKNAEKSRKARIRQKENVDSLRKELETLQKQILKKNCIIAKINQNQGVSENVPNNPQSASAENKLDEEEFTEKMLQAIAEAFDPEKFLKFMNNWFGSKGRSEIRVNNKEPPAGVVPVEEGEQKMKIRVLDHYRKMESDKERYKKRKEDHERNGLA